MTIQSLTVKSSGVLVGAVARRPRLQEFLGYETPASEV